MPCTEAYKEHIMYTFNGFARPSYTMRLSTHGVTGADGGKNSIGGEKRLNAYRYRGVFMGGFQIVVWWG